MAVNRMHSDADHIAPQSPQLELVIGASSGIAQAYIQHRLTNSDASQPDVAIMAISRGALPTELAPLASQGRLHWHSTAYDADHLHTLCAAWSDTIAQASRILICHGMLHHHDIQPEKQLKQLSAAAFEQVMHVNALLPMLWLQAIQPHFSAQQAATITLFSARVGSIEDNGLGGWYSYRASKAALNMMAKSFAVELQRRHPNKGILLFHPGTTDTQLSKPFHSNVPQGKLFTPDFVARQLADILSHPETLRPIRYLDWQGKSIPW